MFDSRFILVLFFVMVISVNLFAQENYARFDLALSESSDLWLASEQGSTAVVSFWKGGHWNEQFTVTTRGNIKDLAIEVADDRILLVWLDGSGVHFSIHMSTDGKYSQMARSLLPSEAHAVRLSGSGQNEVGMLLLTANAVHWYELELFSGSYSLIRQYGTTGKPTMPSVLRKNGLWVAWQEKSKSEVIVAAADIYDTSQSTPVRFKVSGFGGSASPLLIDSGEPALVWLGKRDHRAVLSTRSISGGTFGETIDLPLPEGISSVLDPTKVTGKKSAFAVHGWNRQRWSAIKYDLSGGPDAVNIEVRSNDRSNIYNPHWVTGNNAPNLIVWSEPEDFSQLVTQEVDALSTEIFTYVHPAAVETGVQQFLAFGDSITAGKMNGKDGTEPGEDKENFPGYTRFLQKQYRKKVAQALVVQRGISGENSRQGLLRFPDELDGRDYDFVLLLEGTNDKFNKPGSPEITLEESLQNLMDMTTLAKEAGAIPILGTMLPRKNPRDRESDFRSEELSKLIIPMAQLEGITLAYFQEQYPREFNEFNGPYYSDDDRWVHPDEMGYELMATIWMEALLTLQGDFNRDGVVDSADVSLLTVTMNRKKGSYLFNPDCDHNKDGLVNINDLIFVFKQGGKDFRD